MGARRLPHPRRGSHRHRRVLAAVPERTVAQAVLVAVGVRRARKMSGCVTFWACAVSIRYWTH